MDGFEPKSCFLFLLGLNNMRTDIDNEQKTFKLFILEGEKIQQHPLKQKVKISMVKMAQNQPEFDF